LAGQNREYLEVALRAYRDGQRGGGQAALMIMNATGLSDEDIADLASYYARME
jgi:cytochrome c553